MDLTSFAKVADRLPGGLGDDKPDAAFNKKQLRAGMGVEREHTKDKGLTREIAKDHLTEDPKYYRKLKTIESKLASAGVTGLSPDSGAPTTRITDVPELSGPVKPAPQKALSGVVRIVDSKPAIQRVARTGEGAAKMAWHEAFGKTALVPFVPRAPQAAVQATTTPFQVAGHPGGAAVAQPAVAHEQPDMAGATHPGSPAPAPVAAAPLVAHPQVRPPVQRVDVRDPSARPAKQNMTTQNTGASGASVTAVSPNQSAYIDTGNTDQERLNQNLMTTHALNTMNNPNYNAAGTPLQEGLNRSQQAALANMDPAVAQLHHMVAGGGPGAAQATQELRQKGYSLTKIRDVVRSITDQNPAARQQAAEDATRGGFSRTMVGLGRSLGIGRAPQQAQPAPEGPAAPTQAEQTAAAQEDAAANQVNKPIAQDAASRVADIPKGGAKLRTPILTRARSEGVKAKKVLPPVYPDQSALAVPGQEGGQAMSSGTAAGKSTPTQEATQEAKSGPASAGDAGLESSSSQQGDNQSPRTLGVPQRMSKYQGTGDRVRKATTGQAPAVITGGTPTADTPGIPENTGRN